ncbi:MAG: MMPL family transporter [Deltaproteobacteria bacterium]|nr:MMPL family transporter [Deltaproteobacteria bacterium]MBK8718387.1 MMPL family transporter [Deltaproteobacteria bacterium]MBP7290403.1 MMPL family transporter [Nannocystaceae bacterium]
MALRDELVRPQGVSEKGMRMAATVAAWIERRAGSIVVAFLLVALASGWLTTRLRIDQELRRLLPDDFPSVVGIDRLSDEIGNQSDMYITIRSPSRDANIAFGDAIAARVAEHPDLRHVIFHRDRAFFEHNALLYADITDVLDLRRRVIERIRDEVRKQAYGDLSLLSERERLAEQAGGQEKLELDKQQLEEKYGVGEFKEYDEADEGRMMVVRLRPRLPPTDVKFARALQLDLQQHVDALAPSSFDPEMKVNFDGPYAQVTGRVKTFEREIIGGSAGSLLVLVLSLALYFRSLRSIVLVFVPLVGSVLMSLAFAALAYGFLNLVSAFIFAILLGLGIDFNIVLLARFRDERQRGLSPVAAIATMLATTGPASLFGGASTALGFGVLAMADFQGFAQFGVVANVGVFAAIAAAMIVMPAIIVLMDRVRPWHIKPHRAGKTHMHIAGTEPRWRVAALAVVVIALGWAGWSLSHARDIEFEYDFDKLGPEKAATNEKVLNYRDAVGKSRTVAHAVALGRDDQQAADIYRQMDALRHISVEEAEHFDAARMAEPAPKTKPAVEPTPARTVAPPKPAPPPAAPASDDGDDWDAEEFDDEEEFEDADLADPKFVAMEQAAAKRPRLAPEVVAMLQAYAPERLATMVDRLHDLTSVFVFVPEQQADKLAVIADIRARIDAKRGGLSKRTREEIDEWYHYLEVDRPLTIADLPEWVRAQFTDASGAIGRFVVIWTRGSKTDYRNVRRIYDAFATLETPQGEVALAAEFFVIPEVYQAIVEDGPWVVALSFVVMLCTSIATFRALSAGLASALMVPMAIAWLLGVMYVLGWKLNFFNVIAMPLLVGLGEDAALHVIARYREDGIGSLALVIEETGGAIAMTAWTTICGFGAILSTNHRGLQSLSLVSVVGVLMTFVACVVVLPALIVLKEWWLPRKGAEPSSPVEPHAEAREDR